MPVVSLSIEAPFRLQRSRRLLSHAADDVLVEQMRIGNEVAFEITFERHGRAVLSFCRHMLGSAEEAEDAVQHTFASAWRHLQQRGDRELALRPWLFTVARNRCLSVLRARRAQTELPELETAGLSDEIERRAELRELLRDIGELPTDQREALLLSELGDLSHSAVAGVLGCEVARVKSLVFRARSALIARREARLMPCEEIREQLANLRGGALRRTELRLHLEECPGCRAYRDEVKRQRALLAAALPTAPGSGLELSVLAAAGVGAGGAATGGAVAGGAAAAGAGAALSGAGSMLLSKLALVGLLAGGGVAAGTVLVDDPGGRPSPTPAGPHQRAGAGDREHLAAQIERAGHAPVVRLPAAAGPPATGRVRDPLSAPRKGNGPGRAGEEPHPLATSPGRSLGAERGRKLGHRKRATRQAATPPAGAPHGPTARGRGPVEKPAGSVPVKRGPPETKAPVLTEPPRGPNPKSVPKPKPAAPTPKAQGGASAPAAPPVELPVGKEKAPKP